MILSVLYYILAPKFVVKGFKNMDDAFINIVKQIFHYYISKKRWEGKKNLFKICIIV